MEIQVSHLFKDYGRFRALDDVSLHIGGGMYGLLGPNGAGKTTFMRILATLLPLTAGTVRVGAWDVMKRPGDVRRVLGYLPQTFGFYRGLNAFELLDYIATMKNLPPTGRKAQIESLLEQVHLTEVARRRVGSYSGGLCQRLGIAQALLGDPDLLIVDEPTAGLDPEERVHFRNTLARLSGKRTVLLSTHIVADIEASCVGVAVINQGRLVFDGEPDDLIGQARGKVWQAEVSSAEWEHIEGRYPVVSSRAVKGGLQIRLIASEFPGGTPVEPTLEDGYMVAMTGAHRNIQLPGKEPAYA